VIKIRSAIPHRRALLDIGAAGPLSGLVAALIACSIGLRHSRILWADSLQPGASIQLGSPLLFRALAHFLIPVTDPHQFILLSPVAFAGWVGLFITSLNLLPLGQLDGGHIVYALFGPLHARVARILLVILLGMGLYGILSMIWGWPYGWPGWLVLALFLAVFGTYHPPPSFPHIRLDRTRRLIGYLCIAVLAGCISPAPFTYGAP
jgi:membrane-associated protease RseP (regulator of RpoE activity)